MVGWQYRVATFLARAFIPICLSPETIFSQLASLSLSSHSWTALILGLHLFSISIQVFMSTPRLNTSSIVFSVLNSCRALTTS